ncbi:hypothetical protein HAX54_004459 [Datura stramonium]|uniref:DET1- and DDB1-associated protein 1 n=1 Tax=Datura stramonium TaxID=4076 RepID=A0ABS8T718_DATST|nr:hypothetical protein [Datura stramonium]
MLIVCAMKCMFFGRIEDKNEFAAYVRADLRAGSKSCGTSLPGLPQQSGNPFSMQMQNPVVHSNMPNMEPEFSKARFFISNKIYEYLMQRQQAHEKPPKKGRI